jgi:hypothetical protein
MKVKRLLALTLVFTLLGAATLFADTVYKNYLAKKVTINVNGTTLDAFGLEVDVSKNEDGIETKTMVPLDDLIKSIGGIVSVKNNEVSINKPNVQLSLHQKDNWKPYGSFSKGDRYDLFLFIQIDSLYTNISSLKATVVDPFGDEVANIESDLDQSPENFHFMFKPMSIFFKYNGKYTVNLYMKSSSDRDYLKISQIVVESTTDTKK